MGKGRERSTGLSERRAAAPQNLLCRSASQSLGLVQRRRKKGGDGSREVKECLAVAKDEESRGETNCAVVCGATNEEMTETARVCKVSAVVDWIEQEIVGLKWVGLGRTDRHPTRLSSFCQQTTDWLRSFDAGSADVDQQEPAD